MKPPSSVESATSAVEALCAAPSVRILTPGDRYSDILLSVVRSARASGNLAIDAQIAAVCVEHGVRTLVTNDRDFSRFEQIEAVGLNQSGAPPDAWRRRK